MEEQKIDVDKRMEADANRAISWAKTEFNVNLDYSETSLKELDLILQKASDRYKNLTGQKVPTETIVTQTVILWGAYLGEHIRKKYGGNWEYLKDEPILKKIIETACPHEYIRLRITSWNIVNVSGYLYRIKDFLIEVNSPKLIPNSQTKDIFAIERNGVKTASAHNQAITQGIFQRLATIEFGAALLVTGIVVVMCIVAFIFDRKKTGFTVLLSFAFLLVVVFWQNWNMARKKTIEINQTQVIVKDFLDQEPLTINWADCDEIEINGYDVTFLYLPGLAGKPLVVREDISTSEDLEANIQYRELGDMKSRTVKLNDYEYPERIKEIITHYKEINKERKKEKIRIQRNQKLLQEQQRIQQEQQRIQQERRYFEFIQYQGNLQKCSPTEFEEIVGKCFGKMGYYVEHTPKSHDEGIDLIITKDRKTAVVQCKRYSGSVGQPILRDLYGSMIHNRASEAYLVTTGRVTQAAKTWAIGKPITLIEGTDLTEWIQSILEKNL